MNTHRDTNRQKWIIGSVWQFGFNITMTVYVVSRKIGSMRHQSITQPGA